METGRDKEPTTTIRVTYALRDRIDDLKRKLGKDHLYEAIEVIVRHFETCELAKEQLVLVPVG